MNRPKPGLLIVSLTAAAALVLSVCASLAQDPQPPRPNDRGGPRNEGQQPFGFGPRNFALRAALDKNKDGKISADEIKAAAEALKTLDKDKDGKLNAEEIGWPPQFDGRGRGGFGGRGAGAPADFAKRIMSRDANGDGRISAEELPRSMRRVLELADRNKDGMIDETEAKQFAEKFGSVGRGPAPEPSRPAAEKKTEDG